MRSDATWGFHLWIVGGGDCHGFIEITHLFKARTQCLLTKATALARCSWSGSDILC